jgi:hypothetical protein
VTEDTGKSQSARDDRPRKRASSLDPYSKRGKTLLYASGSVTIAASVAYAFLVGTGWSWPFFIWGMAVAFASGPAMLLVQAIGRRALTVTLDPDSPQARRLRERNRSVLGPALLPGVAIAIIGAASESPWPATFMTAYTLLFGMALPLALLPAIKRRALRAADDTAP